MSSDSSSLTQDVCWSIGKSISSDKSSRSQEVCYSIGVTKPWYEVLYILVLPSVPLSPQFVTTTEVLMASGYPHIIIRCQPSK